ncbi:MAG TPA: HD domain-containing phosphohydrolase [bacterium]|nr:HD domain-containing phosphohydrolase [bacterium]
MSEEKIDSPVEEYAIADLEKMLESATEQYYCVDSIRHDRTKRKLIDPRTVLTPKVVRNLYEFWDVNRDRVIRVTRDLDSVDEFIDVGTKTISHYANQLHRYLANIFTVEKKSYKAEVQGLATTAAEMLEGVLGYDRIIETSIGPADLRPITTYYDHLVNTAIYWLAAFSFMNRARSNEVGSVEVWRSKNKAEMSKITDPRGRKPELSLYYDYYGWQHSAAEVQANKKSDLSLVISGFFGALFHDTAFIDEPDVIISLKGHIDDRLREHMDVSNKMLKERLPILADERPITRNIIKNHHEYIDGSGYPNGKKEKDLHLFSQIISVCDMYDEYATKFVRGKVIRLMAQGAGRNFTGEVLRSFFKILRPYEPGEVLNVYEGKKKEPVMSAEVLESENRFRPRITIQDVYAPENGVEAGATLDLKDDENVIYFI